uniref:Uncharacterized protein n=1 Tax=Anguilla anguilla TaxID=7936 RepID=A0A0E9VDZ9_ANGAN
MTLARGPCLHHTFCFIHRDTSSPNSSPA